MTHFSGGPLDLGAQLVELFGAEGLIKTSNAMVVVAIIQLLVRRLAND